ncbi:MAG: ATP-binding protein [Campylobacterota bacterium]|nr:ATP-binding protein [Campylobacterota bacterium]
MRNILGKYKNSIAKVTLENRTLYNNTLILAEEGSGKTHLANKIRNFIIDNEIPTLYLDFSNPSIADIELRYKADENFNYMQFEESESFMKALKAATAERKHIYMAVNPQYFKNKKDQKSKISQMLQMEVLLENYYYFFHEIAQLNGFYTKFEDFLLYLFDLINQKKYGFTFLSQPHEIFEEQKLKLLFMFLFVGKCSNADYYNTTILKNLKRNVFYYQYRTGHKSILLNPIKSEIVFIDSE